jgi:hypothetical protein
MVCSPFGRMITLARSSWTTITLEEAPAFAGTPSSVCDAAAPAASRTPIAMSCQVAVVLRVTICCPVRRLPSISCRCAHDLVGHVLLAEPFASDPLHPSVLSYRIAIFVMATATHQLRGRAGCSPSPTPSPSSSHGSWLRSPPRTLSKRLCAGSMGISRLGVQMSSRYRSIRHWNGAVRPESRFERFPLVEAIHLQVILISFERSDLGPGRKRSGPALQS